MSRRTPRGSSSSSGGGSIPLVASALASPSSSSSSSSRPRATPFLAAAALLLRCVALTFHHAAATATGASAACGVVRSTAATGSSGGRCSGSSSSRPRAFLVPPGGAYHPFQQHQHHRPWQPQQQQPQRPLLPPLFRPAAAPAAAAASSPRSSIVVRTMASSSSSVSPPNEGSGPVPIPADVAAALQTLYHDPPTATTTAAAEGGKEEEGEGDAHGKQLRLCVVTTGSGGLLPAWMLGTAGASAVLLELSVPYSEGATRAYLNNKEGQKQQAQQAQQQGGQEERGDGGREWGYCSAGAARELAEAAYHRAIALTLRNGDGSGSSGSDDQDDASLPQLLARSVFVGVACTAAVASGQPKKGAHRAHICTFARGDDGRPLVRSYHLELTKGARSRLEEDFAVSKATLAALLQATHPSPSSSPSWFARLPLGPTPTPDATLPITAPQDAAASTAADALDALAHGHADRALFVPCAAATTTGGGLGLRAFPFPPGVPMLPPAGATAPTIIYPGSFNPLHEGHVQLAHAAQALVAAEIGTAAAAATMPPCVLYEIATVNADKGAVDRATLEARLQQFGSGSMGGKGEAVVLTRTPLFVDKARLFPGAYFLIGADTVKRLLDPKYYGNDREAMVLALSEILHLGCRFVVGGRCAADGAFVTLESVLAEAVPIPPALRSMFLGLSEQQFRVDLSSTEIRARLAAAKEGGGGKG